MNRRLEAIRGPGPVGASVGNDLENLAFLGLVPEERRPEIQAKLKGLERKLRMSPMSTDPAGIDS